ncbi:MAG: DUF89 family protein [Candidatus Omnitrophica bacterium]|nr:DUF89 family protein [Candidatus Omnitrophota bacterium]
MKTNTHCIPCFLRQANETLDRLEIDESRKRRILEKVSHKIFEIPFEKSPPHVAREVYKLIAALTGIKDPYKNEKAHANKLVLKLYPELKKRVQQAKDPFFEAVRLAAIGNIIDLGAKSTFNLDEELRNDLNTEFTIFDFELLRKKLETAKNILYIGDNTGEIVFDKILIEEIKKPVAFAVRGAPIINDATLEDALACGLDEVAEVISSGSDGPAAILDSCSEEFLKLYHKADLIISKGQGNFEELSEEDKPIFFIFKVKCQAVAKQLNCDVGDMMLSHKSHRKKSEA